MPSSIRALLALATVALLNSACMMTSAGHQLEPITPTPPKEQSSIEQTVGSFTFDMEGGGFVTSNKMGRMLNDEILNRWSRKGYIQHHQYVPVGAFTEGSRYRLTLSGRQEGKSSVPMQILSGLTLYLEPHFVDTRYKVEYKLEGTLTGQVYTARVAENYRTTWQLFLLFALPWATAGSGATWDNMADHLYEQLHTQGAFSPVSNIASESRAPADKGGVKQSQPSSTPPPASQAPRVSVADELKKLDNLRRSGVLTEEEFQKAKLRLLQR